MGGAGLKAPDHWAMPLCFKCHTELHQGNKAMVNNQFEWVCRTLARFFDQMSEGLGPKTMKTLVLGISGGAPEIREP